MARPVWFEKSPHVEAVVGHLDALAASAKELRFEPRAIPNGTDLTVLHQAALARARRQLSESHAELDRILGQEVRAIDDLVRSANLMVERLREWYALHAPEATRSLTDPEQLAKLVSEHGDRASVMAVLQQADKATTSLGTDLAKGDLDVLQGFAGALSAIHGSWHALEARVEALMQDVAPNVAAIAGPVLGARLIALSGGLTRLATWPTGTVQTLGAETALFRHLKEGSLPPKHGILFQHPLVHQAPPWQRGAIARAIALAASTAAKADAFTRNDLRSHLQAQLKDDLDRIAKEKARPKPRGYGAAPGGRGPPRGKFGGPSRGPPGAGGFRGPPGRGPPNRGPPAYGRDGPSRGPPPRRFDDRAAPGPGQAPAPRSYSDAPRPGPGPNPGAPAPGAWRTGPSNAPSGGAPPRGGPSGAPSGGAPRWGRDGGSGQDGPRSGPRDGPRDGGGYGGGKPPRRKPAGAFRGTGAPAKPPGKGES